MAAQDIPFLVRHCAVAIYESGYGTGSREQKFWHCLEVARWRLVEYGFLRKGSQYGPPLNIKLTAKGKKRENQHKNEQGGADKNDKFQKLYARIESVVETLPMDKKIRNLTAAKAREGYLTRLQEKKAASAAKTPPPQRKRTTKAKKSKATKVRRSRTRRAVRRT